MSLKEFLSSFMSVLFMPISFHFGNFFFLNDILKNELTGILIFEQSFLLYYRFDLICGVLINPRFRPKLWSVLHRIFFWTFKTSMITSFLSEILSNHPCIDTTVHFTIKMSFFTWNSLLIGFELYHFPFYFT